MPGAEKMNGMVSGSWTGSAMGNVSQSDRPSWVISFLHGDDLEEGCHSGNGCESGRVNACVPAAAAVGRQHSGRHPSWAPAVAVEVAGAEDVAAPGAAR